MKVIGDSLPRRFKAKASGSITAGKTLIVEADGDVTQVAEIPASVGAEAVFDSATNIGGSGYFNSAYDSANNKIVIAYRVSGQGYKGYAVVGTISGTSISFGTPVQFSPGTDKIKKTVAISYDASAGKVVIFYSNIDNSSYAAAVVGTVSGTSISFGSTVVFDSSAVAFDSAYTASATYHSGENVNVLSYRNSASTLSTIACSVSGTTPTFGSQVVVGGNSLFINNVYDVSADRIVTALELSAANGVIAVSSCSGTTMTTRNTGEQFSSGGTDYIDLAYDSVNEKTVVFYNRQSDSSKGYGQVITVGATGIGTGNPTVFESSGSSEWISAAYDVSAGKIVVVSSSAADSNSGQIYVGSVSGIDISFSGKLAFNGTSVTSLLIRATYAETEQQTCISYVDYGNSQRGSAILYSNISSNVTSENYIGIAEYAAADTETATVLIKGGVSTTQSSLTPGQTYFVQGDGTIGTSAGSPSVTAGTAVTSTKLIVKG